jgi:tRNA(Arg) A34 adenosine deaminase TadA
MTKDQKFMKKAISKTRLGIQKKEAPFGACIVKGDKIISLEHNVVYSSCDSTAHAEITAIRTACKKLKTINLSGCTIYSTTEPCPMCFSAIHWAKFSRIVFGTRIRDAKRIGFSEIPLTNRKLKNVSKDKELKIKGDVLREENLALLKEWKEKVGKTY